MWNRIRRLACKLFGLEFREEPRPLLFSDLWDARDFRPVWPLITADPFWKRHMEPWLKWALLRTFVDLSKAPDPERIRRLQVRAELLNELLEAPILGTTRVQAAIEHDWRVNSRVPSTESKTHAG